MRREPSTQVVPYTGEIGAGASERDVSVRTDQILRGPIDTELRQCRSVFVHQRCLAGIAFITVGRAFTARLARRKAAPYVPMICGRNSYAATDFRSIGTITHWRRSPRRRIVSSNGVPMCSSVRRRRRSSMPVIG